MNNVLDVTGGQGGISFLIVGEEKTALIDCGMGYCAANLISNIKQALNNRELNYILISHSHYDHIGAIPYLKEEWPNSKVYGAEHARGILTRQNALSTIRELGRQAAAIYGSGVLKEYDDELLKVDECIRDGDILDLGRSSIRVLETPGHTKCSLSFLIDNETLFPCETTGCMSKSGKIYSAFITSYSEAIAAVYKCQATNPRYIISPHFGQVSKEDIVGYWENCILAIEETKAFILDLAEQGYAEAKILAEYEKAFRDEQSRLEQPVNAFRLNAQAMIKTVLKENP